MTAGDAPPPAGPPSREEVLAALAEAEGVLTRATMRLGRLRTRNRGSALHRDLTSIAYDVQTARQLVAAVLYAHDAEDRES